jgi:hypothetical protein
MLGSVYKRYCTVVMQWVVKNLQIIAHELSITDFCSCTYVQGYRLSYCCYNNNNSNNNNNKTNRTIPNNKLDITIHDNKQGTCMLVDVTIPGNRWVVKKETEKI